MKSNMTVTMSLSDYERYENIVEKYNELVSKLNNCLFLFPTENRVTLNRDEFISLVKNLNPAFKDSFFDI